MKDRIWKTAAYMRLSREDGDKEESNSIGGQRNMILDFIQKQPDMKLVREYVDDGVSGVSFDRPGFKKMMKDLEAGTVDAIVVKDFSRFARNYIDSGRYLEKTFPAMGVRFLSLNDNYDSFGERSQADSLIVPFKGILNDAYCRDISMKIRSQLDIKRKMGDFIGAFCTYGYKKSPDNRNRLIVDEEAAKVVELIFRLRLRGMSNSGIAQKLNSMGVASPLTYKRGKGMKYKSGFQTSGSAGWTAAAIHRVLTNEIYIGTLTQHRRGTPNYKVRTEIRYDESEWIVIPNNHQPIIEQTDFDTVQQLLGRDVRIAPGSEEAYLFSGFVFCGSCGHNMVRTVSKSNGRSYSYLVCSTSKAGKGCSTHCFSEEKLKKIVFSMLRDHISQICQVGKALTYIASLPESRREIFNYDAQIVRVNEEIQKFQELKLKLYSDMSDEGISREEYSEFRSGYDRRIAEKQAALRRLEEEREQAAQDSGEDIPWIRLFRQYENITELHRGMLVNTVEKIIVHDAKHIELFLRYQNKFEDAMEYISRFRLEGV